MGRTASRFSSSPASPTARGRRGRCRGLGLLSALLMVAALLSAAPSWAEQGATSSQAPAQTHATEPPPGPPADMREPVPAHDGDDPEPVKEQTLPSFGGAHEPDAAVDGLDEAAALRSEGARFFEVPGGGVHVAQVFSGPINYQGADGRWHPIDSDLVSTPSGYSNAANSFDVTFPRILTEARPMTLELPEGH